MNYFDVKDKVVAITGASSGIGYGLCEVFAKAGSKLVMINKNPEKGAKAEQAMKKITPNAISLPADVSDRNAVKEVFKKAADHYGTVDVLINAAGIIIRKLSTDMTDEDWNRQIDTNLKGTFNCCVEAAPYMIKQRSGKIINIASNAATRVGKHTPAAYSATKAGIHQMTRTLGIEYIRYNINVNVIGPGFFETAMNHEFRTKHIEEFDMVKAQIPQGRVGDVAKDLGGVCIFLASEACSHMVGQMIYVDGGNTVGDGRWDIPEGRMSGS